MLPHSSSSMGKDQIVPRICSWQWLTPKLNQTLKVLFCLLSSSLTSEDDWDPPEKVQPPPSLSPVATATQAPKAKWMHTNHDLNTETPSVSYFTLNMHTTKQSNNSKYDQGQFPFSFKIRALRLILYLFKLNTLHVFAFILAESPSWLNAQASTIHVLWGSRR